MPGSVTSVVHVVVDSVRAAAQAFFPTISVQPPPASRHDVFDYLSLALTVSATFVAARYGAEAGVRAEWVRRQKEIRAQEGQQLKRLIRRLERDATTVAGMAASVEFTNRLAAVIKAAPMQLEAICNGFDGNRVAVALIGDDLSEHDIERFYEKCSSLAVWMRGWEVIEQGMLKEEKLDVVEHTRLIKTARGEFASTAKRGLALINRLRGDTATVDVEVLIQGHIAHYVSTHPGARDGRAGAVTPNPPGTPG